MQVDGARIASARDPFYQAPWQVRLCLFFVGAHLHFVLIVENVFSLCFVVLSWNFTDGGSSNLVHLNIWYASSPTSNALRRSLTTAGGGATVPVHRLTRSDSSGVSGFSQFFSIRSIRDLMSASSFFIHDTSTGNWRYVFTKVVYDPESFIHVNNSIGKNGFQPWPETLVVVVFVLLFLLTRINRLQPLVIQYKCLIAIITVMCCMGPVCTLVFFFTACQFV